MSIFFFKCQGQNIKYQQKDLITRNIHVYFQSSSTQYSNVLTRLKHSKSKPDSKVKVTRWKILVSIEVSTTFNTHYSTVFN